MPSSASELPEIFRPPNMTLARRSRAHPTRGGLHANHHEPDPHRGRLGQAAQSSARRWISTCRPAMPQQLAALARLSRMIPRLGSRATQQLAPKVASFTEALDSQPAQLRRAPPSDKQIGLGHVLASEGRSITSAQRNGGRRPSSACLEPDFCREQDTSTPSAAAKEGRSEVAFCLRRVDSQVAGGSSAANTPICSYKRGDTILERMPADVQPE